MAFQGVPTVGVNTTVVRQAVAQLVNVATSYSFAVIVLNDPGLGGSVAVPTTGQLWPRTR